MTFAKPILICFGILIAGFACADTINTDSATIIDTVVNSESKEVPIQVIFQNPEKSFVEKYGLVIGNSILFAATLATLIVSIINTRRSNENNTRNIENTIEANRQNLERQIAANYANIVEQLKTEKENLMLSLQANVNLSNRQKWIDDLREGLSEFLAKTTVYAIHKNAQIRKGTKPDFDKEFMEGILACQFKCRLLINQTLNSNDTVIDAMMELWNSLGGEKFDFDDFMKKRKVFLNLSQELLKKQWEKIEKIMLPN